MTKFFGDFFQTFFRRDGDGGRRRLEDRGLGDGGAGGETVGPGRNGGDEGERRGRAGRKGGTKG